MNNHLATPLDRKRIEESFQRHDFVLDFGQCSPSYLDSFPRGSGVYLIAGEGPGFLKAYVGKARSLRSRLKDYHRGFQVHCPNDRKMAFFQDWLSRSGEDWELRVFSLKVPIEEISSVEAEWINTLNPLANGTARATDSSKSIVHEAYRQYFESYYEQRVREDG